MELADTSAWTNRHKHPIVSQNFEDRLVAGEIATCAMVTLELLFSARDVNEFRGRRTRLSAIRDVPIEPAAWNRATDVFEELAATAPLHHRRVKLPDIVIAATAELAGLVLCHYDGDFETIAAVTGQPVRAIAALGSL